MARAPSALLMGLSYTSLPVARCLGRKGIPVVGIDNAPGGIARRSRYVRVLDSPSDDAELMPSLVRFAKAQEAKPVLFAFSDEYLVFVSRNREELSHHFSFPYPRDLLLEQLVSKETMGRILGELGVSMPRTVVLRPGWGGARDSHGLSFPLVIKPIFHSRWLGDPAVVKAIGARKALLVEDNETLHRLYALLGVYGDIVAQEFVPGRTENLYYYVGYRSRNGQALVSFVGRKLRTLPDMFGSETFLQSVGKPEICELGEQILDKLGYVGPAGLDFKFDARDKTYKLIEINCRLGISDGILISAGVDIPYIYYQDSQGLPVGPAREYQQNVYWCWVGRDLEWFREYGTRDGFTVGGWLKHFLLNRYSFPVGAKDDPGPFLYALMAAIKRLVQKGLKSAAGVVRGKG